MTEYLVIGSNFIVALSTVGLAYVTFKDCAKEQQEVIKTLAKTVVTLGRSKRRSAVSEAPRGRHEAVEGAE